MHKICKALGLTLLALVILPMSGAAAEAEMESLRGQIKALNAKVAELEALEERLAELESLSRDQPEPQPVIRAAVEQDSKDYLDIGGALRFNYMYNDWDSKAQDRGGDFDIYTFRFNVDGSFKELLISAEYRFYGDGSNYNFLHHGWVGYDFSESVQAQLGVTQVPFGILPYASHNFFFQLPYYVGLEDDYDAGIKLVYDRGPWNLQLAFFKSSEYGAANSERYSYDVVHYDVVHAEDDIDEYRNEESNQLNVRLAYTLDHGKRGSTELGLSGEVGQLYNSTTDSNGSRVAGAVHLNTTLDRWNLMVEALRYQYNQDNPAGLDDGFVVMGAYDAPYKVARAGNIYMAGLSYSLPVQWGPITDLTLYDDYSFLDKDESDYKDSQQNVLGVAITAGPVYTYIDFAMGKNPPWLGPGWTDSLARGDGADDEWHTRFNINFGYYF
jgi:outer membrane murein-binding lipoprotein Lpp